MSENDGNASRELGSYILRDTLTPRPATEPETADPEFPRKKPRKNTPRAEILKIP